MAMLPVSFFERILKDVPVERWIEFFEEHPESRRILFEGFSLRPGKIGQVLGRPSVLRRFQRLVQSQPPFLEEMLLCWGNEMLPVVAFVEMLDQGFVKDNLAAVKDLVGPDRLFACLSILGFDEDLLRRVENDASFWVRNLDADALELLDPARTVWEKFLDDLPQVRRWEAAGYFKDRPVADSPAPSPSATELKKDRRREWERRRRVEEKLAAAAEEAKRAKEEMERLRRENEALRTRLRDLESGFEDRLSHALRRREQEWFQRYESEGTLRDPAVLQSERRLADALEQARRALGLQEEADRRYGLVSKIGRELLELEVCLNEIERVYRDSLVVHNAVARAKSALLAERDRILSLPGIQKVFERNPELRPADDLRRRLHLLEPSPENLSWVLKMETVVKALEELDAVGDPAGLKEGLEHKKHQILAGLYRRFPPPPRDVAGETPVRNLDDFVRSGESAKVDVYVDGYNLLFQLEGTGGKGEKRPLSELREAFVSAVLAKSRRFRKVVLVFDGVGESRERRGNVEIIYSDKTRGISADMEIVQALKRRKDARAILVTADREIITASEKKILAVVEPLDFYAFVFDLRARLFPRRP